MAQNDMIVFDQFREDMGNGVHDLSSDVIKFGLVDNVIVPTRDTANPHWGATGTDLSVNEADYDTAYVGPVTLANTVFSETADVFTFDADNPAVIAQDGAGDTNIYYLIAYNETATNDPCIFAIDLGGAISLVAGSLTITFHVDGIFKIT